MAGFSSAKIIWIQKMVFLEYVSVIVILLLLINTTASQHTIKNLPGFDGDLPFHLETGYIGVGENDEQQMFYYFTESEREPEKDPLVLALTEGPGCSAISAIVFEYGPFMFNESTFGWSLPLIIPNQYSWTKVANIIFLDWPVGSGFSYATTQEGYHTSDSASPKDIYMFLNNWLLNHPKFMKNPLIIGGVSYAGKTAPMVAWEIAKANEERLLPHMSLQGYFLGNPWTTPHETLNDRIPYVHNMGLVPDEYFRLAESSCNGEYVNVDINNTQCKSALRTINECIEGVNPFYILEHDCPHNDSETDITVPSASRPKLPSAVAEGGCMAIEINSSQCHSAAWHINECPREDLDSPALTHDDYNAITLPSAGPEPLCREMFFAITEQWVNNPLVRQALHIREGTKGQWIRCNNSLAFEQDVDDTVDYNLLLAQKGYNCLVYSGDHDIIVPHTSSLKWIRSLNLAIEENWRSWRVDGKVAGYTLRYKGNGSHLTFATVKGAGHTPPEDKGEECLAMFSRWLSHDPL